MPHALSVKSISTYAMSARNSRCRFQRASSRSLYAIAPAAGPRSLGYTRIAVTIGPPRVRATRLHTRLALIGKRPKPVVPRLAASGGAKPARERAVYFTDPRKASPCPVYQRETLGAGSKIAGPALIQEHGTTTVLFAQDALTVAPSGELIITVGAACCGSA